MARKNPHDPNGDNGNGDNGNGGNGNGGPPRPNPVVGQAHASIGEGLVNAVLTKISVSGQKNWNGNIPFPVPPGAPSTWSVTVRYTVSQIHATIASGEAQVTAKVHADSQLASYTHDVNANLAVSIQSAQVCVRVNSLVVPLYVKPLGHEIHIGDFDICDYLDGKIEACFEVLPIPYTRHLPPEVGGAQVTVTVGDPKIALHAGEIVASVTLGAS